MISRSTIDRIFQAILVEDVIGEFVHLKKSGSSYRGLSPFVNEKTPSFFVVPSKGIYKDFSSGRGGNAVDFLMQHEKMTYPEALRWLAARYNIEIEEEEVSEEQKQEKSEREQLGIVTEFANKYFQDQMYNTETGRAIGLSYFEERGFREDILKKFQLGYCPDGWDKMSQAALTAGHSLTYLLKSGLTREKDGSPYDFFRGRVMFPIHNVSGKVIAFGGRTLKVEKEIAKYFNSPESDLYHKSNTLYGMHLAKNAIVKEDNCFLVEGYTDVISLHQAGVENVVASSGTSLTEGQIRLIRRFTQNITILYDGDKAGIKASFRGIDMILKEGLNVRVATFPDGDDPDSFARKHSSEEIQRYIAENAKDFIRYKTSLLLEEVGDDPLKRAGLIRSIVESIALIPDAIKRSVFVQECAQIMRMTESVLLLELNKALRVKTDKSAAQPVEATVALPEEAMVEPVVETRLNADAQERELIRVLLQYGNHGMEIEYYNEANELVKEVVAVADYLLAELEADSMELFSPVYGKMLMEYQAEIKEKAFPDIQVFVNHEDELLRKEASDILANPHQVSDNWKLLHNIEPESEEILVGKAARDVVYRVKLRHIQLKSQQVQEELEAATEDSEIAILLTEKKRLDAIRTELAKLFGTIIL